MIQEILKEHIIDRNFYISRIKKYIGAPVIKVLIGQRRVGKSSILKSVIAHLLKEGIVKSGNFFYINKESPYFDHIKTYDDLKRAFEEWKEQTDGGKIFIGIDEVQDIQGWEKFVNGYLSVYQENAEIFITGSNSFLLSGELATYLTGRYVEFPIYPLSFDEFCLFKKAPQSKENFLEYLKYG